ncbi:MAG: family ATPase [Actinomycetospora sp.]|nr:family ATPase [Actinomycetospora sp.]
MRRKLTESPRHARILEQRLGEAQQRVAQLSERNDKLTDTLKEARAQLVALREEVDRLAQPPSSYGVFLEAHEDSTVDVFTSGRRMRVAVSPAVETAELTRGQSLRLNEALTVVEAGTYERIGEVCALREVLTDEDGSRTRALIIGHADEERVIHLADSLLSAEGPELKPGDSLMVDTKVGYAYEKVPKAEVEELVLEEVPDVAYTDIGGLSRQIDSIRDAVELPFLHADLFRTYQLRPPKGVLLYGPPGCGKTLIAKAVANSLAKKVAETRGEDSRDIKAHFLNIKGPELLNKFVGETERHIRMIFQRAREKASEGTPVEDMIDPAILRPGRLDVKIKIERPDAEAAIDIFGKYLIEGLPVHEEDIAEFGGNRQACLEGMIERVVERMYAETDDNRFLEVTYANGDKEVLYFKDFNSGAVIENIVGRAKKSAIKSHLESQQAGLRVQHLLDAVVDEFAESEDLPNTTNPDDWARISGKKGERIVYIRTLVTGKGATQGKEIDTASNTGQYL